MRTRLRISAAGPMSTADKTIPVDQPGKAAIFTEREFQQQSVGISDLSLYLAQGQWLCSGQLPVLSDAS